MPTTLEIMLSYLSYDLQVTQSIQHLRVVAKRTSNSYSSLVAVDCEHVLQLLRSILDSTAPTIQYVRRLSEALNKLKIRLLENKKQLEGMNIIVHENVNRCYRRRCECMKEIRSKQQYISCLEVEIQNLNFDIIDHEEAASQNYRNATVLDERANEREEQSDATARVGLGVGSLALSIGGALAPVTGGISLAVGGAIAATCLGVNVIAQPKLIGDIHHLRAFAQVARNTADSQENHVSELTGTLNEYYADISTLEKTIEECSRQFSVFQDFERYLCKGITLIDRVCEIIESVDVSIVSSLYTSDVVLSDLGLYGWERRNMNTLKCKNIIFQSLSNLVALFMEETSQEHLRDLKAAILQM